MENHHPEIFYPSKLSFINEKDIKTFPDKHERVHHHKTSITKSV